MKQYVLRESIPEIADKNLNAYPEFLRKLLFYRNIETQEKAHEFLNPSYESSLHDPYLMKDMEKAVSRILQGMEKKEKIVIYSDYDADGIPAAVVLGDFFKKVGYDAVTVYIPHRHTEGYGLHRDALKKFKEEGVSLVITLDCGIADSDEADFAAELGIDLIITDHHLPVGGKIPKAFAVLNSKQDDCQYPFDLLCGAGVAFKLVQALLIKLRETGKLKDTTKEGWEKWLLDMVGIATLSDMVPLQGENRALAHFGLKVLRKSPRPGLQKLLVKAGVDQRNLVEDDIGFTVTPRINAASRMGDPIEAYKLLSADDDAVAGQLADYLDTINTERKNLVAVINREAKKTINQKYGDTEGSETMPSVLVLGNPSWRPAVLGLVANALVGEYGRPVFMWGRESGDGIKGSCRSGGAVNLVALMEKAGPAFAEYGGHALSGGFSVKPEDIHGLEPALVKAYEAMKADGSAGAEDANASVLVDAELALADVNERTYTMLQQLAPFGIGNPKPLFMFRKVVPASVKQFGKSGGHLELSFKNTDKGQVRAIGFFMKPEDFTALSRTDQTVDLIATIEKSYFRNRPELRLRIIDII